MEGTAAPISFHYRVCRACQDDGRRIFVLSSVPSSAPLVHSCGLFPCWGSRVVVGSSRESERDKSWVAGAALGFADTWIDSIDSLVDNPFAMGPPRRLCYAYDELLLLILSDDLDFDSLALEYHRLRDEQRSGLTPAEPMELRILREIARRHDVQVSDERAARFSFAGVRAWVAFHLRLLQSGRSLRLLGPCPDSACPPWSTFCLSLAGALVWAGWHFLDSDGQVTFSADLVSMVRASAALSPCLFFYLGGRTITFIPPVSHP